MQENRVEEALKQKRQKEYFIDMTSHEMRKYHLSSIFLGNEEV